MFLQLRYPLRPSRAQHARLAAILRLQRNLYNAALERRRATLEAGRHLALKDDQAVLAAYRAEYAEHAALPWGVNDWTLRRLDAAMRMHRDRLASGEEPGLPRFRSDARWRSFGAYGLKGWSLDGDRIRIEGLQGSLRVLMHRPLPEGAKPIGLTFTRIARRWFVTIMVAVNAATEHAKPGTACGVDVGVNWLAMLSDGTAFENIRPRSRRTDELRAAKRALSRCQKDSRRRRKVRNRLARAERRVFDERSTHLHQVSAAIVRDYATVVVEDLALKSMTRAAPHRDGTENPAAIRGRNRAMADAAPGRLIEMIRYKAEKAGGRMIKVDPRHTSQACYACEAMAPKPASADRHICACGVDMHRDHNAALNILARGTAAYAAAPGRGVGKASANARLRPARPPRNAATVA